MLPVKGLQTKSRHSQKTKQVEEVKQIDPLRRYLYNAPIQDIICAECHLITAPLVSYPLAKRNIESITSSQKSSKSKVQKINTGQQDEYAISAPISNTLLLTCSNCPRHQHPICIGLEDTLIPNILIPKIQTYSWRCLYCTMCFVCEEKGFEEDLVYCNLCDRCAHLGCLKIDRPNVLWFCEACAICQSCSAADPKSNASRRVLRPRKGETKDKHSEWEQAIVPIMNEFPSNTVGAFIGNYCTMCYGNFLDGRFCPFCVKTYAAVPEENSTRKCQKCARFIHRNCDSDAIKTANGKEYICTLCSDDDLVKLLAKAGRFKWAMYKNEKILIPCTMKKLS